MVNVMAKRLLGKVSWGLTFPVMLGAGLSILDMAIDIFVVWGYMGEEETKRYGWSLLGMVARSMVLQLLMAFAQNRKKPWVMVKEMLIIFTCLKSAVDASRVVRGHEMEEHHIFDARTELVATKAVEMACESIPGRILQLRFAQGQESVASDSGQSDRIGDDDELRQRLNFVRVSAEESQQ